MKKKKKKSGLTRIVLLKQATSIRSIRSLAPLLDRVLVQRIKAETKTASGIFLPESSVEKLNEGKVLAVGPGALDKKGNRMPMGVAIGDRVLIPSVGASFFLCPSVANSELRGICAMCVSWCADEDLGSMAARLSRLVRRSISCSGTASKFTGFPLFHWALYQTNCVLLLFRILAKINE